MESSTFVNTVDMRKKLLPAVVVYGDGEERELAKLLFSLIPGLDVRFLMPDSRETLLQEAYHSAIVFILVNDASDDKIQLAKELTEIPGIVADIIAITPEQEIRKRLHMLTYDFDNIFNWEILNSDDFRHIFTHKLEKGIMRLNARIQEDEYRTFKAFLSVSPDAFIVFDKNKRLLFVSDHYIKAYPSSASTFVRGTPVQTIFDTASKEAGLSESDPRYIAARKFWATLQGQFEYHQDNGRVHRLIAAPMPDGEGTIVTTTDITLYKQQEKALADKQSELTVALANELEASNLQKQFISMVSHEFRTPLSIVDGNAQILERRSNLLTTDEILKRLKTIRSAVARLVNMMETVLSSNMVKTGRLDLVPEDFSLKDLIRELCLEQGDLATGHLIRFDVDKLPERVTLDRKVVTLVLTNLLSNAVKYSLVMPVVVVNASKEGGRLHISVLDNGVGIPPDEVPKVFDRFYRASTSSGVSGSGVGLSLVKDLVTLHGGSISVESTVGKGTRFDVIFPGDLRHSSHSPTRQQAS